MSDDNKDKGQQSGQQADDQKKNDETTTTTQKNEDKGSGSGDDVDALKKQNQKLLAELTSKKTELGELKTERDSLIKEKTDAEAEQLKKKGEFEKLYKQEKDTNDAMKIRLVRTELKVHAQKEGIIDLDDVDLISTDKIKISDTLEISGIEEVVKTFKELKPHKFAATGQATQQNSNQNQNKGQQATGASVSDPSKATQNSGNPEWEKFKTNPNSPEAKAFIASRNATKNWK